MGKASSSKKVARAARAGGRVSSRQPRSLLFPGVLAAVVILGLSLVIYAREDRRNDDRGGRPQLGDHFHTAIGVNVCDEFLGNLPEFAGKAGLHDHGDGLIHIEPVSELATGSNVTLGLFVQEAADSNPPIDFDLDADSLSYLGTTYEEGESVCEGVEEPQLRLAYWENGQDLQADPLVTTGDFGDRLLTTDGAALTIYYGDPDADIPPPLTAADLPAVGSGTPADMATTTTVPGDDGETTSTTSGEPSESTTTTAAVEETTTTAAP